MADFTAYVYQEAFALTAAGDFNYDDEDDARHITNLSVNKKYHNHPGQIPVNVMADFPAVFDGIKSLWTDLVNAVVPFMAHQRYDWNCYSINNNDDYIGVLISLSSLDSMLLLMILISAG